MKIKYILYALVVILVGYLVYRRLSPAQKNVSARSAGAAKGATNVNAMVVKPGAISDKIMIMGSIMANEEVIIRPEVSGKITNIYLKEGSFVNKGTLLIKINDSELQAQLSKALTMQKLAAQKEYRQRILLEKEAVSKQDYDAILAELNALKAETDLIRARIKQTEIRAPFSGNIGLREVSLGDYVTPSANITSLVDNNPAKIVFSIPEKYAVDIAKNSHISFNVKGSDKTYQAEIYARSPKIDKNTRTLQLKARVDNSDGSLLPGQFAEVEMSLSKSQNALLIPTQAVIPILNGKKVYISKNGKAKEVMITTGIRNDSMIMALSGLNAGDTVITTGIMSLIDGAPLKINHVN